jgi:hypothetical protein
VTLYDLHACSIVWRSEVFAGKVALTTAELLMGEQTVKLDHQCVPIARRHD